MANGGIIVIEINQSGILKPEHALEIRAAHNLDHHDKNKDQIVHFIFGDKVNGASKAFLKALFEPSMKADQLFEFAEQRGDGCLDYRTHSETPGNYVVIANGNEKNSRVIGDLFHYVIELYQIYDNPRIQREQLRQLLNSDDRDLIGYALKILKKNPELDPRMRNGVFIIELDTPRVMTTEDALSLRCLHNMDELDKREDVTVHIVMGPNIKKPSRTFINALMEPSFKAGRSFGYQFHVEWLMDDKSMQAGNYMIVASIDQSEAQRKTAFEFHHVADNLYSGFEQEKQYWQIVHSHLNSYDPKEVAFALKELRRHEKLSDFFEAQSSVTKEKSRVRVPQPTIITLNDRELMTTQHGQSIRKQYGLDALDLTPAAQVHFVIGPDVKGVSNSFIEALMVPAFEQGRIFGAMMLDEGKLKLNRPANYILQFMEGSPLVWGNFKHPAETLYRSYQPGNWRQPFWHEGMDRKWRWARHDGHGNKHGEIVTKARDVQTVFAAVNHLRMDQLGEDLFEAGLGQPEQVDVRANEGDALAKYGLKL